MKHPLCVLVCVGLSLVEVSQAQLPLNTRPARAFGYGNPKFSATSVDTTNPNRVEGHELYSAQYVAVDRTSSPAILYVADTYNNRVLAWFDPTSTANNAPSANLVIGQRDPYTTFAQGPSVTGTTFSKGLNQPTGLAVDAKGNLWVVDAGNNRILRYSRDKLLGTDPNQPSLVIGQPDYSKPTLNNGGVSAKSVYLGPGTASGSAQISSITFDASGNLWLADTLNHRVLRYPAASLEGSTNQPEADLVLGQTSMADGSRTIALTSTARLQTRNLFYQPNSVAFDPGGRLYVSDALSRVLVFEPPFATGQTATRVMGVVVAVKGQPVPAAVGPMTLALPRGIAMAGDRPVVVDATNSRILVYDSYDKWPAETATVPSPAASLVIGQSDFGSGGANRGSGEPGPSGFSLPIGLAFDGNDLYVADSGNNRVLDFPIQADGTFADAVRVFGQFDVWYGGVNLLEGKELYLREFRASGSSVTVDFRGAIAVDRRSTPPRLYVADPGNNRVLCFEDARNVNSETLPKLVIGQPDFRRGVTNYPSNDADVKSAQSLYDPTGLAVASNGDLWVVDAGNGRVLRFPSPFDQPVGDTPAIPTANLVLGQQDFTSREVDPSAISMGRPVQVALTANGSVLVSDYAYNRVLFFRQPTDGDFVNGQAAEKVFGQPDFVTITAGNTDTSLNAPLAIATDTDDYLYVADRGNQRIQVYSAVGGGDPIVPVVLSIPITSSAIYGLFVSADTGEIWVADFNGRILRFPNRNNLILDQNPNLTFKPLVQPIAITLDPFGNPIVADVSNRLTFYFPPLTAVSAASYLSRPLSPGMQVALSSQAFITDQNVSFDQAGDSSKMPTTLKDVQVLVNGTPAPIRSISAHQISLITPWSTPTTGTADVIVLNPSSQRILATGTVSLAAATPSLFTVTNDGKGQVVAVNADGSKNDTAHPATAGDFITLYGTGQGVVSGAPTDGEKAAADLTTDDLPDVYFPVTGTDSITKATESTVASGDFSTWKIKVKVPKAATGTIRIAVVYKSIPSNSDGTGATVSTTIVVK